VSSAPLRSPLVVVPTAGRRDIAPLVCELVEQASASDPAATVLVLDNSASGLPSTRAAADVGSAEYLHVGTRGLASVRNAALDAAVERSADAVVFIDDDERPVSGWLAAHLDAAARFDADVVLGPVPVEVPPGAPRWVADGRVLRDVPDRATGLFDGPVNAGNTLVRLDIVQRTGVRFDTAFDATGGEDTMFFGQLRAAGAVVAWARDAVAPEIQDADRLTFGGFTRRLYEAGQRGVLVERGLHETPSGTIALRRTGRMVRGAGTAIVGSVTLHPDVAARGVGDMAFGWGSLTALAGRRPNTYAR